MEAHLKTLVKGPKISPNISSSIWFYVWRCSVLGWSNDPTFTEHFVQHLILCLTIFNAGLVKRSNISLNISCNIWFYVWRYSMLGWSNDLTFHWTFENSRNFGWNIGLFLILSKFHPASLNIMLDDWTWLLNHPAFHWTRTFSEYGMICWIVWPRLKKVILVYTLISSCFPLYYRCSTI